MPLQLLQLWYARDQYSEKDWIRPGQILRNEGLRPKYPVVIVPGKCLCRQTWLQTMLSAVSNAED